jgi:hypothetical protein
MTADPTSGTDGHLGRAVYVLCAHSIHRQIHGIGGISTGGGMICDKRESCGNVGL